MSYGCPVLISDIEANLDAFSGQESEARRLLQGELGFVFRAGDVSDLAASLGKVLARDDLSETGMRSRKFALEFYHWDNLAQQTMEVYHSLLAGR